jgi:hypothetical protein
MANSKRTTTSFVSLPYKYADLPQRVVKRATVYRVGLGAVEGVVINPVELDRLANWACTWDLFGHHADENENPNRAILTQAGSSCEECLEGAAFMLAECPYVEMNRSPYLGVKD